MQAKTLITFLLFFIFSTVNGQYRQLRFDRFTVEDGLPENFITTSLQDKYGYIWLSTQNGLVRYDGYKLKVYNLATNEKKEYTYRSIRTIFEDSKGNLWLGTHAEGVFRYNRTTDNFTNFRMSLPGNKKEPGVDGKILEDKEGKIWSVFYSSNSYLKRIDPSTGDITKYDSTAAGKEFVSAKLFYDIKRDQEGNIWLASEKGLFKFNYVSKKFDYALPASDTSRANKVELIYEAPSQPGILWLSMATKSGLSFVQFDIKSGKTKIYLPNARNTGTIHNDSVLCILEDKGRNLWIGTNNGLSLFQRATEKFKSYIPGDKRSDPYANACRDIQQAADGGLWVITGNYDGGVLNGKGLLYLAPGNDSLTRFQKDLTHPKGLPTNSFMNLLVDRNGVLWLGTRNEGLLRLNEQASQFELITKNEKGTGFQGEAGKSIARLKSGNLLVTTSEGLYECNPLMTSFKLVKAGNEIPLNFTKVDRNNIAWICSNSGLWRYDPASKKITNYINDPSDSSTVSDNRIRFLYEDSRENFWVGTYGGGLCRLDRKTGKFVRYPYNTTQDNPDNGKLDDDQVTTIFEDRKGALWIGTNNGGLNKLNEKTGRFTSYFDVDKGMTCVTSIFEDSRERLWLGTYLWGIFLFDRNTGNNRRFSEKEGLIYNQANFLSEDKNGKIWAGTDRGFSIIDPINFSIKTLTSRNGLPVNAIGRYNYIDQDGTWIISCSKGFIKFNPSALKPNITPPGVILQAIRYTKNANADSLQTIFIHNQSGLEFAYNENRISFQFAGIHFTNSGMNQSLYKLDGYDKDWIDAGNQHEVTYTNLSPGNYTFLVKSASSDGIWSKQDAFIKILINPPWWRTWWAYLFYALTFTLAVGSVIIYRSRSLRRQNNLLEEKVNLRTHQLSKANQELNSTQENLVNERDKLEQTVSDLKTTQSQLIQSEKMASLGELTAGIAHEIQNPLNFVNNFSEVNKELLAELNEEIEKENYDEVKNIANDITANEEKINHHGRRADAIVKGMLQHSRSNNGVKEPTDINALADEYLRLSYHGLRAKDKSFNATLKTDFDETVGNINIIPQDMGRVILNLITNAFYSVNEKKKASINGYDPTVTVSTRMMNNKVVLSVADNGNGIPQKAMDKIFQPFFTTKPTGEGTGLGLSMSYDIVSKGHGGEFTIKNNEGEGATFTITLPK